MKFFSDFCLRDTREVFSFLEHGIYHIGGFGYGAFEALEFGLKRMQKKQRVQKLFLIAPVFNLEKYESFALHCYQNNQVFNKFLKEYHPIHPKKWQRDALIALVEYGVCIEVFIGFEGYDHALVVDFFQEFSTLYLFKKKGHLLHHIPLGSPFIGESFE